MARIDDNGVVLDVEQLLAGVGGRTAALLPIGAVVVPDTSVILCQTTEGNVDGVTARIRRVHCDIGDRQAVVVR